MPSYTTSLRLVQPATGEYSGTWGTQVNTGITALVDASIAGTTSITMTAANYTLTTANGASDESRAMFLVLGGTPGAAREVIVPAVSKLYFVTNSTTGGFAQTVKTASGSGISVPNGARMTLRCDGTDVVAAQNYFASLTLGSALPVASGGTGSTSTTYCSLTTNVTGTLPIANGGTGQTTQQAAINALAGATTSGQFLRGNGTNVTMSAIQAADVPTLNQNTTGTASNVTGIVAVANGGTGSTTSTGSGAVVLATSPTLTTPVLGTPSSVVLTNATGLPLTTGVTGTLPVANGGTGVTTSTGSGNNVLSTSPTFVTPILGTPSSVTLTNGTGLPLTTGVTGTLPVANGGTGVTLSTGSGSNVLSTSPTLTTPVIGAASATSITNGLGAAGTPSYTFTGDTNTGIWSPAADTIALSTGGNERVRIDSSGNFLLGKTAESPSNTGLQMLPSGEITSTRLASTNAFSTMQVYSTGASAFRFYVDMAGTVFATSTTISAISDQRLKENIRDLDAGLPEIMALKPRKFDWKPNKGKDKKNDRGWIAQEFEQVFPDMVATWKDPAPEGEEPYKAVNADLIPVLVKAIQEQQALITDLRARVAALEQA